MHNPDLYQESNSLQKRDVLACLEKHASKIKWKRNNNRIIDIGSGDGSVTNMLKKYIPTDFKLLGCDISESMVNFANDHHCNEQTSFTVLDIAGDLPEGMRGSFDHVFSFYTLHWVKDQERAFKNIFNLMDQDGECFMIVLASHPILAAYRVIARNSKWSTYLQDVEKYVSPYQDLQDPAKEIIKMLEDIGYIDIDVEARDMAYIYDNSDTLMRAVESVNPFIIPSNNYKDYLEDYMKVLEEITDNDFSADNIRLNYKLLIVHAHKPSPDNKRSVHQQ